MNLLTTVLKASQQM